MHVVADLSGPSLYLQCWRSSRCALLSWRGIGLLFWMWCACLGPYIHILFDSCFEAYCSFVVVSPEGRHCLFDCPLSDCPLFDCPVWLSFIILHWVRVGWFWSGEVRFEFPIYFMLAFLLCFFPNNNFYLSSSFLEIGLVRSVFYPLIVAAWGVLLVRGCIPRGPPLSVWLSFVWLSLFDCPCLIVLCLIVLFESFITFHFISVGWFWRGGGKFRVSKTMCACFSTLTLLLC